MQDLRYYWEFVGWFHFIGDFIESVFFYSPGSNIPASFKLDEWTIRRAEEQRAKDLFFLHDERFKIDVIQNAMKPEPDQNYLNANMQKVCLGFYFGVREG